jgi:hypothetical protein
MPNAAYISLLSAQSATEYPNLALGNADRIRNWATDLTKTSYTGTFSSLVHNLPATAIVVDNRSSAPTLRINSPVYITQAINDDVLSFF